MLTTNDAAGGEAAMAKFSTILRTTFVKPNKPIGRKEVHLTTFDLQYLTVEYIERLLVYRTDCEFEDVEEKLKDGLRLVLEDFYPLAGKMVKDEEGILKVEYNDEMNDGAEFIIAVAEETLVTDMAEDHEDFPFQEFLPYNCVPSFEGLHRSLLAVKLTKLKDGFVLGYALNHAVVDGTSVWHFLTSWADRCNDQTHIPNFKPFHDRTKARNTRVKINLPFNSNHNTQLSSIKEPTVQRLFSFSESTIDRIKSETNRTQTGSACAKPFSTFLCMAAHVWRAITRARQLMPGDSTVFSVMTNIRNKLDPPLPETYFGNLVLPAIAGTTAGVLFSNPPEISAALMQQAIEILDSKTINTRLTEWEKEPKLQRLSDFGKNAVGFGSSPKFRVRGLDFGWGKPEVFKSCYVNRISGTVFMYEGKNGERSIDIDIVLENKVMKRLEMDKEFLMED